MSPPQQRFLITVSSIASLTLPDSDPLKIVSPSYRFGEDRGTCEETLAADEVQ